ncbi:hypothetical protein [Streptomyces celluloflavus]|uniref:hypothetical protein n=1 Tax=Streptomyces celluloflavus TaxID=58344 RepID=UPI00364EF43B
MLDKCVAAGQGYEREGGPMDFTCIGIEDGPHRPEAERPVTGWSPLRKWVFGRDMLWGLKT